ncbi:hypothetical protein [Haloglomus salinum]|uniref:hypothetical protein n=1 Tax=Haloglomus salinum TaxID=2962673 RepID=UPI0020C9E4BA|nr:hypothetical protein [Haloglomus salinum]
MNSTLTTTLQRLDLETRIQYGLMFLFGSLCLLAAIAPLELLVKAVIVSTLFGFTAGIWVSHLVQIVQQAAERQQSGTTQ